MKNLKNGWMILSFVCIATLLVMPAWSISGGDVINSTNANITTSGSTTSVDVLANRSIIDWSNFNTSSSEILEFQRAGGADFAVLNRIMSGVQTDFQGTLNGNQGHIIVINPNGIVFGPTAEITAHRFTASTLGLNMDDSDFLGGDDNFRFTTGSARGKIELLAGSEITADQIELLAHRIINQGHIRGTGNMVVLATGDDIYLATDNSDIVVNITPNTSAFNYSIDNQSQGIIENIGGKVVMAAGDSFAQALAIVQNNSFAVGDYNIDQRGTIQAAELEAGAAQQINVRNGSSTDVDTLNIASQKVELRESITTGGNIVVDSDYQLIMIGDIASGGDMSLTSQSTVIFVNGSINSDGTLGMNAGTNMLMTQGASSQGAMQLVAGNDIISHDDLTGQSSVAIQANETFAKGDITAINNLSVISDVTLFGTDDQYLSSATGAAHLGGDIYKFDQGNIYISGQGNVRVDSDITADMGGVSIISDGGRIHSGTGNEIDIAITGYSDNTGISSVGVDLPYTDDLGQSLGKAAVVLQSNDDLVFSSAAELNANGSYASTDDDPLNGVDDRAGVNFLSLDEIIGDNERDQGVAGDVAIYAGSKMGNVTVNTREIDVANAHSTGSATVVFDAYNSVSMPFLAGLDSDSGFGGFRLEVASRTTEWLYQAAMNGTLPFADNPGFVADILGNDYVLRGAGLGNNAITDGRAWVLEDPEPVVVTMAVLELPEATGCPMEMEAAALELGITPEALQLSIRNSMAMNPDIQACDVCARLVSAANILNDFDGSRLAAMNQIFNNIAPPDAPFAPEMAASIVTAFTELSNQDRQYALATEYVDAFVAYVAILDNELQVPVGDPVMFAMERHGQPLFSEDVNPNVANFILSQTMPETL